MIKNTRALKPVLSAVFLALGIVLPFLTGQIRAIGNMLLPMHIPVLLCGFICGFEYGLVVGFIMPLLRSFLFSMPVFYPSAVCMAVELAVYGFVSGFVFEKIKRKNILSVYTSLILSIIFGRAVWGIAMKTALTFSAESFGISVFFTRAFLNAIPGIILQLIVIPTILLLLDKTHILPGECENR